MPSRQAANAPARATWPFLLVWLLLVILLVGVVWGVGEVALHLRRERVAATYFPPDVNDPRFVIDRLLRYTNRPGYQYSTTNQRGESIRYTINSLGFRGPPTTREKPPGLLRVVVVGGSTVYGALDDDGETLPVHLQTVLQAALGPKVEVINAGVPSFVATREALYVKAYVLDLQPDAIVDFNGLNDVFFGTREEWPAQIAQDQLGVIGDGRFPDMVQMIDRTMFSDGLVAYQLRSLFPTLRDRLPQPLRARPEDHVWTANPRSTSLYAGSVGLLADYADARQVPSLIALQPLLTLGKKQLTSDEQHAVTTSLAWRPNSWVSEARAMYQQMTPQARSALQGSGAKFLDLTSAFDDEAGTTYAEDAVHYTSLGNRRLAEKLAPYVEAMLRERPNAPGLKP